MKQSPLHQRLLRSLAPGGRPQLKLIVNNEIVVGPLLRLREGDGR